MSAITTASSENYYVSSTKEKAEASKESSYVTHNDFLKLLTTQLTHQDPLSPMEDIDFTGQLAQLQALDEQVSMTKAVLAMRIDNQLQGASSLIGKYVTGYDEEGSEIGGIVERAVKRDDQAYVILSNNKEMAFTDVGEVRQVTAEDLED